MLHITARRQLQCHLSEKVGHKIKCRQIVLILWMRVRFWAKTYKENGTCAKEYMRLVLRDLGADHEWITSGSVIEDNDETQLSTLVSLITFVISHHTWVKCMSVCGPVKCTVSSHNKNLPLKKERKGQEFGQQTCTHINSLFA